MRRMDKKEALQVLGNYAVNWAIRRASEEVRDAIDAQPYDRLGWYEMDRLYDKVADRLRAIEEDSLYFYSSAEDFIVARWSLGEGVLKGMVMGQLRAITSQTVELLGEAKLERKKAEAEKAKVE